MLFTARSLLPTDHWTSDLGPRTLDIMRRLLYIPIIHVDSDLGSMADSMNRRSVEICGKEQWERHKEIVTLFWDKISDYFTKLDARDLEIYQDGLMANGELGRRIIEEGAKKGSRNYEIILDLIKRGAKIRKTEDVELLKKELHRILQLAQTDPEQEDSSTVRQNRLDGERLMEERDRFAAKAINKTLKDQGQGVLFMGAFHNVLPHLADDIEVVEVKSSRKVKEYFRTVISGGDSKKLEQLAGYMVSDV